MFKDTITYTDYNGETRTEDVYFNLSKPELIKMEYSVPGGLTNNLTRIINRLEAKDVNVVGEMFNFFEEVLTKSYGIKSDDGKRFIKSQDITDEFVQSELYSEVFMKFNSDPEYLAKFIMSVMPADLSTEVQNSDEFKRRMNALKEDNSVEIVSEN